MSLNLIGRASGICHFLAISGLALAWGRVGRPPPPAWDPWRLRTVLAQEEGLGARAGCLGGRRRREAAGCWGGRSGEAEKRQARCAYFNLINDRTPLRVCFNNQDTLQQVDRVFAVNLHMSSERAVSINNVPECAGCTAASAGAGQVAPRPLAGASLSWCLRSVVGGGWGWGTLRWRSFLSREFPGLPTKIRARLAGLEKPLREDPR